MWSLDVYSNPHAVTTDSVGNIYLTGGTLLWKISPTGQTVWKRSVADANGNAVVVDDQGGIYAAGYIVEALYLAKYDSAGVEQWTRRFNGSGTLYGAGTGLVAMPGGGMVVTGLTANPDPQFITIRYSAAGTAQWVAFYDEPVVVESAPFGIVRTSDGGVAVAGASGPRMAATVKYSSTGTQLWVNRTDLTAAANATSAKVRGLQAGPDGGAVVLGSVTSGAVAEYALLSATSANPPAWKTTMRSIPLSIQGAGLLTGLPGGGWVVAAGLSSYTSAHDGNYAKLSCVNGSGGSQTNQEWPAPSISESIACRVLVTGADGAVWAMIHKINGYMQIKRYGSPAPSGAPVAATVGFDNLQTTSVRFKGTVNPHLEDTTYYYEFGPTTAYGSTTPVRSLPADAVPLDAIESGVSISPGTTYHFRIVASNGSGTSQGVDQTFTVPQSPYQQWATTHFGSQSAPGSGPIEDPDFDRVVNLVEFAFGSSPSVAGSPPGFPVMEMWTSPDSGITFPSILYRPDPTATGITVTPVASNNLVSWTTSGIVIINQPDGSKRAVAQGFQHFMRLQITMP